MKPKAHAYYSYIGGGLLAAAILAIAGWGPLAIADKVKIRFSRSTPSGPNRFQPPSGPTDLRIPGYRVRSPETASTRTTTSIPSTAGGRSV